MSKCNEKEHKCPEPGSIERIDLILEALKGNDPLKEQLGIMDYPCVKVVRYLDNQVVFLFWMGDTPDEERHKYLNDFNDKNDPLNISRHEYVRDSETGMAKMHWYMHEDVALKFIEEKAPYFMPTALKHLKNAKDDWYELTGDKYKKQDA